MYKNGGMSGGCDSETTQMERFLSQIFGFCNSPGKYIIQGIKSFQLIKPPHSIHGYSVIYFPMKTTATDSFVMSVEGI